jgi:isocitrate dehydrogenase kinase/phosphatase
LKEYFLFLFFNSNKILANNRIMKKTMGLTWSDNKVSSCFNELKFLKVAQEIKINHFTTLRDDYIPQLPLRFGKNLSETFILNVSIFNFFYQLKASDWAKVGLRDSMFHQRINNRYVLKPLDFGIFFKNLVLFEF